MSRGNLILLGALGVAVGLWLIGRNWATDKPTAVSARLFRDFNREGADRIEISGGPSGTSWAIAKALGSDWSLVSAGGYPVKRPEVDRFLDGVANLRKDNPVGTSPDLRVRTQTDEKGGRLVRVLQDGKPIAEFYVGKNPKQGYSEFFVRKEGDDTIYRTHTVLTKDREQAPDAPDAPGAPGFDWHSYTEELSRKWIDPEIWDLAGAEAEEIRLTRPGLYDATIAKQAQDKWELTEGGNKPVPADADVADGILSVLRRLSLYEVLGTYDDVRKEYGLESPDITVLMTLRKKIAKPAPKEGEEKEGEPKEGEPKEGEPKKEEYKTFHRVIEVGKKVSRPHYDSYSDEVKSDDYYAIHVGPANDMENPAEAKRAGYVFLVRDYTASQLRKDLSDLKAKAKKEEGKGPGEGEAKPGEEKPEVTPPEDAKPGDEKKPAEEKKPADEKKPAEEKETPKGDDGTGKPKDEGDKDKGCG